MLKALFLIGTLLMSFGALAQGNDKGNGGDGVVCRDALGEVLSVELLDYYEGRVMRNLPQVESPELSDEEFYKAIGAKINDMEDLQKDFNIAEAIELNSAIHEYLATGATSVSDILFTEDILTDIPDSAELVIKKGCKVEQLAIWILKQFPEDPRFILQGQLIKHLSPKDIRGLVIHEILYKHLFWRSYYGGYKVKNSKDVRYLHQKLLSKKIAEFKFSDYFQFIRNLCSFDCGYAGLRKKDQYLDVSRAIPREYGFFMPVLDFRGNQAQSKIYLIVNKEGKLDRELTLRYGSISVSAYHNVQVPGYDYGSVRVTSKLSAGYDMPFGEGYHYYPLKFGENRMTVNLNPLPGSSSTSISWGIKLENIYNKDNYVLIDAAIPQSSPKEYSTNFRIHLDEKFNVIIKKI